MPRAKPSDPEMAEELARNLALRKERQARQAIEGAAAMAEYRKAGDDALNRMAKLREKRLEREATQNRAQD